MQQTGMSGWFYRVLKPGIISCQDALILKQRRTDISVAEAMKLYFRPEFDAAAYDRLLSCEGLAASWLAACSATGAGQHRRLADAPLWPG